MHLTCIISFLADLVRYLWKTSTAFCTNPWGFARFFLPQVTALSSNHQVPKREKQKQHGKWPGRKLFCLPASAIFFYNYIFTCIHTIPHIQITTHTYVRMFREVYLYTWHVYFGSVLLQSIIYNICLQYNYTYPYIHTLTDTWYTVCP